MTYIIFMLNFLVVEDSLDNILVSEIYTVSQKTNLLLLKPFSV